MDSPKEIRSLPMKELEQILEENDFRLIDGKWRNMGGITVTSPIEYWVDVRMTTRQLAALIHAANDEEWRNGRIRELEQENDNFRAMVKADLVAAIEAELAAWRSLVAELERQLKEG